MNHMTCSNMYTSLADTTVYSFLVFVLGKYFSTVILNFFNYERARKTVI